jgi:hypothetical protein
MRIDRRDLVPFFGCWLSHRPPLAGFLAIG